MIVLFTFGVKCDSERLINSKSDNKTTFLCRIIRIFSKSYYVIRIKQTNNEMIGNGKNAFLNFRAF